MPNPTIKIAVSQADATLLQTTTLTAHMEGTPTVKFSFSSEWAGLGKTVVFRAGSVCIADQVLNSNNEIIVPGECFAEAGVNLIVGVYGSNTSVVIPTVWCSAGEILDGTDYEEATNIGTPTAELVETMSGYVEDVRDAAQALEDYAIRSVNVDDDDANTYGTATVQASLSGSGETRALNLKFSDLKGNGIESVAFSEIGNNRGRLQITESDGTVTTFDGIKEALDYLDGLTDESEESALKAEGYAVGTQDGDPSQTYATINAQYFAGVASTAATNAGTAKTEAETAQGKAETAQGKAEDAQTAAESAATSASEDATSAAGSASSAAGSASDASSSAATAEAANVSAVAAKEDAEAAKDEATTQALKAEGYAVGTQDGASSQTYSTNNAKYYRDSARTQAQNAAGDATTSTYYALQSEGYAVGSQYGTDVSSGTYFENNAKYYAGEAKDAKDDAEAAQTAAETAQGLAEDAQEAAETAAATFTTDATLSVSGKAADAKATGDALASQSEKIDEVKSSVGVNVEGTKYESNNKLTEKLLASYAKNSDGLDGIAFGNKTYRDLFITNNMAVNGSFTNGSYAPATVEAGSPVVSSDTYSSAGYSLKAFGSSSAQIAWKNLSLTANHYYMFGAMVRVDRYSAGSCGAALYYTSSSSALNARIRSTTNNKFKFAFNAVTPSSNYSSASFCAGSYSSANADCYVDDIFLLDMTEIFPDSDFSDATAKTCAQALIIEALYNYIDILNNHETYVERYYYYRKPKFVTAVLASNDADRFKATRYALRTAERKLLDLEYEKFAVLTGAYATSAAVCVLPENSSMYRKQGFEVVYGLNETTACVPASITKVVTAITALPFITSIKNKYTIASDDIRSGSGNVFQAGDVVTIEDLLYAMMLPSSNTAATALAHYVGIIILDDNTASESDCETAFLAEMAKVVANLGCTNTTFVTPSGLSDSGGNQSSTTCADLLKIGVETASWDILNRIWNVNSYTISVLGTNARTIDLTTTVESDILEDAYMILGGKTGTLTGITPNVYTLLAITEPK